jgi:WD40 repeat protein
MLPDGHILSWATDCVVRLWDEAAGAELLTLRHDGRVNGAQMLDDGRILSWSDDGTVRLWVVEPQALLEIVAELQLMPFTSQEREQFFMPPLPPTATPTPFPTVTPLPPITVLPTLTALPTLTPSPLPTSQFVDFAIIGEQQGEVVPVRYASQTWRYAGSEGEQLTIRVLADNPGSGSDPLTWGAEGKLDTWLFVYTPNGSLLAENDDRNPTMTPSGGVADTDSELTIVLPEDGIYSFVIGSAYGGQTSGEYTLVVEAGGDATLAVTPSAMPSFTPVPTPDG